MDAYVQTTFLTHCPWKQGSLLTYIRLNASEQRELQTRMETKQMQEFVKVCSLSLLLIHQREPGAAHMVSIAAKEALLIGLLDLLQYDPEVLR